MTAISALVRATGNLIREPEEPATVPVPLPIIMIHVDGLYTVLDRKLWVLLLHLGWDELETKSKVGEWHEITEKDLLSIVSKFSGTKDLEWIWQSAERLAGSRVKYVRIEGDRRWKGVTGLFSAECLEKEERNGVFRYAFPAPLVPIIKEPGKFARLRVQFMLGLKSKYSVTLYELFESVANMREPILSPTIAELRQWLQVPEGKLTQWGHLYKRAIKPALDEINENAGEGGITVSHEVLGGGKGKRVTGVTFHVTKTEERQLIEKEISTPKTSQVRALPQFPGSTYEKAKHVAPGWDVYALESEFRDWLKQKGHQPDNIEAAFIGFCKKKVSVVQAG
ncbi:MAG: replication initiation protein [Pseudanabaena sp. CRU_2_10]|nr:replication initiation protein [Pseudanabaena sp. CRU_2_10]